MKLKKCFLKSGSEIIAYFDNYEDAKLFLHKFRNNGGDGFVFRDER